MTAPTYTAVKPCKKCGTADRYATGVCKKCKSENKRRIRMCKGEPVITWAGKQLLANLPGDCEQLMAASGLSRWSVKKWQALLREAGHMHIARVEKRHGGHAEVYAIGPGPGTVPPVVVVFVASWSTKAKVRCESLAVQTMTKSAIAKTRAAFPLYAVWG
jgi:hypothetical protein